MTPLSFEWQWTTDYFLFMGLLYLALAVVGCGLAVAYLRTWLHMHKKEKGEQQAGPDIPSRAKYQQY